MEYNDAEHLPTPFKWLGPHELLSLEHQENISLNAKRLYGAITNTLLFWGVSRRNFPDSKLMDKSHTDLNQFLAARQELVYAGLIEIRELPEKLIKEAGRMGSLYQILHTPRTRRVWAEFWDGDGA